jgi:hypothetical protein
MLSSGKIDPAKLIEDAQKAYQDLQNLGNCSNIEDFVDAAAEEFVQRVKVDNATARVADVDSLYVDVMAVVADIKSGNEAKLLLDLTKAYGVAQAAVGDCTPSKIVFGSNPNADMCADDAEDAIDQFMTVAKMIQSGDVDPQAIVTAVGDIAKDVNNMIAECTSLASIITVVEDEYVKFIKVSNPAQCQSELSQAYPLIQKIVKDL